MSDIRNEERLLKLEERGIRNETNITTLQIDVKEIKVDQVRCTLESKEDIINMGANLKFELVASENRVKDELRRTETQLRNEITDTRKEVTKIMENDLIHIRADVDTHIKTDKRIDAFKVGGAIMGVISGVYIVITNASGILQWLTNVLNVFFH